MYLACNQEIFCCFHPICSVLTFSNIYIAIAKLLALFIAINFARINKGIFDRRDFTESLLSVLSGWLKQWNVRVWLNTIRLKRRYERSPWRTRHCSLFGDPRRIEVKGYYHNCNFPMNVKNPEISISWKLQYYHLQLIILRKQEHI